MPPSFTNDLHKGLTFDYIMANPPLISSGGTTRHSAPILDGQIGGVPPESNANYADTAHPLEAQRDAVLLDFSANGALGDSDASEIRRKLIEGDKVEAIIVLPRELFYATDISVTLWILNQKQEVAPIMVEGYAIARAKSYLWISVNGQPMQSKANKRKR